MALVGRAGVGKSTLFNRLVGKRVAVVGKTPGVTRDRLQGIVEWRGQKFTLVDTGGREAFPTSPFATQVERQVEIALREADLILFLGDGKSGVTPLDEEIALFLRHFRKPVLLGVNKLDHPQAFAAAYEFSALGWGEPLPLSALHGLNMDVLLDQILSLLPPGRGEEAAPGIRIAVVGRPNVGKSSLVNCLLGEERVIVSSSPGTTRDAVDTRFFAGGQAYTLVDTAGLRQQAKVGSSLEAASIRRAYRAIRGADVALLVLDASAGVTAQDKKIAGYLRKAGKAAVLVGNKKDLLAGKKAQEAFLLTLREELPFMDYVPRQLCSARTGEGIRGILKTVNFVFSQASLWVPPGELRELFRRAQVLKPPPRPVKSFSGTQRGIRPPFFFLRVQGGALPLAYCRFLENQLRQAYGFQGVPLKIVFQKR